MRDWTTLKAQDGHQLSAYISTPADEPIAAVVIVQEIFGVNKSIRDVADDYASHGFIAIAPALFDRFEPNVQLGYGEADMQRAFQHFYPKLNPDISLLDIAAAFRHVKQAGKPTGVLGFCYGGLTAWLSATRGENLKMQPGCCVGYYAGGVGKVAAEEPVCPVMLHFGAADDHIGPDQIDAVRTAHPNVEIFQYPGVGHAFANPDRPSYNAEAATLAHQRSLAFLKTNLA
jgi:carboxymethylenebutenolidase